MSFVGELVISRIQCEAVLSRWLAAVGVDPRFTSLELHLAAKGGRSYDARSCLPLCLGNCDVASYLSVLKQPVL